MASKIVAMKDDQAWHIRESYRQGNYNPATCVYLATDAPGYRRPVVWAREPWVTCQETRYHFVHTSVNDPTMIAYTESDEKGARDIQTRLRPGRYLMRYYSHVLTEKQCAEMAEWQLSGQRANPYINATRYPLAFAATPDDIAQVYIKGPASCMSGGAFPDAATTPVRVYGAGDLSVAYLSRPDGSICARALVWPAKKVFGRGYPSPENYTRDGFSGALDAQLCQDALYLRLRKLGYTKDHHAHGFEGARLLKIRMSPRAEIYALPYLDGAYGVTDDDACWRMTQRNREYDASETNGLLNVDDGTATRCERCEDLMVDDDLLYVVTRIRRQTITADARWCSYCVSNNSFFCEGLQETVSDDLPSICVEETTYAEAWAEAEGYFYSDFSDTYFWSESTPQVELQGGETWTAEEFSESGFTCQVTGYRFPDDDMHPDHTNVWKDVPTEELEAWLALQTTIPDLNQGEMPL